MLSDFITGKCVMAQLERNKDDDHYFIRAGPSQGTWQITEEGVAWLRQHVDQLPMPGEKVPLLEGTYRLLKERGYLYIRGIVYEKHETFDFALPPASSPEYGPSLLLSLQPPHDTRSNATASWTLLLKLDELDEQGQEALLRAQDAVAIGSRPSVEAMVDLRWIQDARRWPEVSPKTDVYEIYWQNSHQQFFRLHEATPALALRENWQGNVFRRFEHSQLSDAWRCCRPNEHLSLPLCQELYWLARTEYDPEWPDQQQPMGVPIRGWQLWHLRVVTDTLLWEAVEQWLSSRLVHLIYPSWRLRLLNPLSFSKGGTSLCWPDQQILVQCDPPTQPVASGQMRVFLSLASGHPPASTQLLPALSSALVPNQVNYFRGSALPLGQDYQLRVKGEANGQRLLLQVASFSVQQPSWFYGLRCTLKVSDTSSYTFEAFTAQQQSSSEPYELRISDDFSQEELAHLVWDWQPAGIPCSCTWEYLPLEGEDCQKKSMLLSVGGVLTTWWQTEVVPALAESPWIRLTLDAASFGTVQVMLMLKPALVFQPEPQIATDLSASQVTEEAVVSVLKHTWWTNQQNVAYLLWLSNVARRETAEERQVVPAVLSQILRQLCEPDMPVVLKKALMFLATQHHMPVWMVLRLRGLLAELHINSTRDQFLEERW
jgi:hypothetical protein